MPAAVPTGDEETGIGSATTRGNTSTLARNPRHDDWATTSLMLGTFACGVFGAGLAYAANRTVNGEPVRLLPSAVWSSLAAGTGAAALTAMCLSKPGSLSVWIPGVLLTSAAGTGTFTWFSTGADHMDVIYGLGGAMGSVLTAALACATAAISDKSRTAARNSAWPSERGREPIELATLNPHSPGQATSDDATADAAVLSPPPAIVADTVGSRGVAPHEETRRSTGSAKSDPGQSALPRRMTDPAGDAEGRRDTEVDNESIYGRPVAEPRAFV